MIDETKTLFEQSASDLPIVPLPQDLLRSFREIGLSAEEILFVLALNSFTRGNHPIANPGLHSLSFVLGRPLPNLVQTLKSLEAKGMLTVTRGKGRGQTSQYDLTPLLNRLSNG